MYKGKKELGRGRERDFDPKTVIGRYDGTRRDLRTFTPSGVLKELQLG